MDQAHATSAEEWSAAHPYLQALLDPAVFSLKYNKYFTKVLLLVNFEMTHK